MTGRVLPPNEWPKLAGTELEPAIPHLRPETTTVWVVEDDDRIVGCWAEIWLPHLEGVWIHPAYRGKTSVARRLWQGMKQIVHGHGGTSAITGAACPEIHRLLTKHATALPQEYVLCL